MLNFVSGAPVRHPRIERIEDTVTSLRSVELWSEFQRRVINNRRLVARGDLIQQLPNQGRLPGTGVAHEQKVAALFLGTYREDGPHAGCRAEHAPEQPAFLGVESKSIRLLEPVEGLPSHQLRTAECVPSSHLPRRAPSTKHTDDQGDHAERKPPEQQWW